MPDTIMRTGVMVISDMNLALEKLSLRKKRERRKGKKNLICIKRVQGEK